MGIVSFEPQEEEYVPSSREKPPISHPLGHKSEKQGCHFCTISHQSEAVHMRTQSK